MGSKRSGRRRSLGWVAPRLVVAGVFVGLWALSPVHAQDSLADDPPSEIEQQIAAVEGDAALSDEERTRRLKILGRVAEARAAAGNARRDVTVAMERTESAPRRLDELRREAVQWVDRTEEVRVPKDPEELKAVRMQADTAVLQAREALATLRSQDVTLKREAGELPARIAEAKERVAKLEVDPIATVDGEPPEVTAMRTAEREATLEAARADLERLIARQAMIEAEAELRAAEIAAAERELQGRQKVADRLAQAVERAEQRDVAVRLERHRSALAAAGVEPSRSLLFDDDGSPWLRVVEREATWVRQLQRRREDVAVVIETKSEVDRLIGGDDTEGGVTRADALRMAFILDRLPSDRRVAARIRQVDQEITELRRQRAAIDQAVVSSTRNGEVGFDLRLEVQSSIDDATLAAADRRLAGQYREDVDEALSTLIELRTQLELQRTHMRELRQRIDGALMWIRTRRSAVPSDLPAAGAYARQLVSPTSLRSIGSGAMVGALSRPQYVVGFVLLLGLHVFWSPRARRRLVETSRQVRRRPWGSIRPTVDALVVNVCRSVLIPGMLWLASKVFDAAAESAGGGYGAIAGAFRASAAFMLPLELIRQAMRRDSLAAAHFGFSPDVTRPAAGTLRWVILLGAPLVWLGTLARGVDDPRADLTLGRLVFVVAMAGLTLATWRVFHPRSGMPAGAIRGAPDGWLSRLRVFWFPAAVLTPVVLAGLMLAGFDHAAVRLIGCLYGTVWITWAAIVTAGAATRWLRIHARRSALRHRMEARRAIDPTGGGIAASDDDWESTAELDDGTRQLIRAVGGVAGVVALYYIWSPVAPAVEMLDHVELWSTETGDGTVVPITLAGLLIALPVILLSVVAVRRLPGLVEAVVLSRLPIRPSARYAITSLTTYAIAALGVIVSAGQLGLRWDNIQWLVAALGVGLGFGLQEIFANFISGLILLFEQPLRVGDIVTLGDTTGVVSKIRIRATTVTNWDRQELVIPNKDLITGRLVNWTLSDSSNRVLINVGVAYDSDPQAAVDLLHEIVADHPQTLADPAPVITFEGFGDSTLDIVVRCYLASLDVRLQTIHELHRSIHARFGDAGIEIAFPQRDLHLRTVPAGLIGGGAAVAAPGD